MCNNIIININNNDNINMCINVMCNSNEIY